MSVISMSAMLPSVILTSVLLIEMDVLSRIRNRIAYSPE